MWLAIIVVIFFGIYIVYKAFRMKKDKEIVECAGCHHFTTREDFLRHNGCPRCGGNIVV